MVTMTRQATDYYPTPAALARAALAHYGPPSPALVLEPGAGSGIWGRAAGAVWRRRPAAGGRAGAARAARRV